MCGLVHGEKPSSSRSQWNVAPASPLKPKLGEASLLVLGGLESITGGAGAVLSTVQVKLVGSLSFPATCRAFTSNV